MKTRPHLLKLPVLALAIAPLWASFGRAAVVKDGDVVAVVGDSITEGKQYSGFVEDYLLMCQPAKARAVNFGWGGEQAVGLVARIADPLALKPTVVTLNYGMNDGHYTAVTPETRSVYHANLLKAVRAFKASGATVIVGSPGCVDPAGFDAGHPNATAAVYNVTLAALRDEAAAVAKETGCTFADVHDPMMTAMAAGKAKFGDKYSVAGGDGVHPQANGGLVMAYAYLKALGFDGNLGTIRVDLAAHTATAEGPHTISKVDGNVVSVHSTAYPFCFWGDPKYQTSTTGLLDAVPFNADLNRLTLQADGPAANYKVTWGKTSKTFTREQLHAGINLAAEFLDNPFVGPFYAVHQAVIRKQNIETVLYKQVLHDMNSAKPYMPGMGEDLARVAADTVAAGEPLAADVARQVQPVDHTITIKPAE